MKICAIDFETANRSMASVCAVGISVMEEGALTDNYYSLIRPEKDLGPFSPMNIAVHGIRPADVRDAPDFRTVYQQMKPFFEDALVCAHNARFDMACLKAACRHNGIPVPHLRFFDTVELSRKVFPHLEHHRLNDMCDYLHVELDHHNALSDSTGCLMIVMNVMNLAGIYEPEELLEACRTRIVTL
ncbi:MAG: exonuclease [Erysipelotrichaceae bacterium]|nr:exonuclease [Erysipelotrichaceae bacterium]